MITVELCDKSKIEIINGSKAEGDKVFLINGERITMPQIFYLLRGIAENETHLYNPKYGKCGPYMFAIGCFVSLLRFDISTSQISKILLYESKEADGACIRAMEKLASIIFDSFPALDAKKEKIEFNKGFFMEYIYKGRHGFQ